MKKARQCDVLKIYEKQKDALKIIFANKCIVVTFFKT